MKKKVPFGAFELDTELLTYLAGEEENTKQLIRDLCGIPAPSWHEEKRAEFCKAWLEQNGAEGVTIDSALNVLYPVGCEGKHDIVLFLAHTDTVFPDLEPMPFSEDDEYLYAPGVGDDTACLAVLLTVAKYVAQKKLTAPCGILFAANAGEEGLGNLKGIRQIMQDYAGRIQAVYSFDGRYDSIVNQCVGSHRYEITAETIGGHSFGAFGNPNAIHELSKLICRLYQCDVPVDGASKTTYNVGGIEGGTSVNTIAQSAKMLYEYRSDSAECLAKMKTFFEHEIALAQSAGTAKFSVRLLGTRPCDGEIDREILTAMAENAAQISKKYSGMDCPFHSGSTDCNIPMSLGVPAVCVGAYLGNGAHTREERMLKSSIPVGLKIAAHLILSHFGSGGSTHV